MVLWRELLPERIVEFAYMFASEMQPFIPVLILNMAATDVLVNGLHSRDVFGYGTLLAFWWFMRNRFDDRWKRRVARALEEVTRRGSRLVVQPTAG